MEEKMTFEQANRRLEETVRRLEQKNITLEESMKLYADACDLLAYCVKELDAYKGRITDIHRQKLEKRGGESHDK